MRFVDTGELTSLSPDGTGPWRMGEDRLLRTLSGHHVIPTEEQAREMLEVYRAVAATGVDTPDGREVVRMGGGYGVVVDYVTGVSIGTHIAIGSYSPTEVGQEIARLLHELHAHEMSAGRDYDDVFRGWAHGLAPLLPEGLGTRLVELVEAIPRSRCLLHGDMHVGNVIVCNGSTALIDLESAGHGNPVFDLAIAQSRALFNCADEAERMGIDGQYARRVSGQLWTSLLEGYFPGASEGRLEQLERRITVLSELEYTCFAHGVRAGGGWELNAAQKDRLAAFTERLEELLPQVDRLDLS